MRPDFPYLQLIVAVVFWFLCTWGRGVLAISFYPKANSLWLSQVLCSWFWCQQVTVSYLIALLRPTSLFKNYLVSKHIVFNIVVTMCGVVDILLLFCDIGEICFLFPLFWSCGLCVSSAGLVLQSSSANAGCSDRLAPRILAPAEPNHKADGVLWLLAGFSLVNVTKRLLIACYVLCLNLRWLC